MNHDTMKYLGITLFLWIGCALSATAAEAAATVESAPAAAAIIEGAPAAAGTGVSTGTEAGSSEPARIKTGTRTARWLDVQREGRAAGNLLPVPGAEAGPSHQRYIDSFATPIPDSLRSQTASGAKK